MIGIVGHGFVGSAVGNAFDNNFIIISDPLQNNITIQDILNKKPDAIFVCVPTPESSTGHVDGSIVSHILSKIPEGIITILKSTITPEHIPLRKKGLVYNPEFLTQANAKDEFMNPQFHVLGGYIKDTKAVEEIYKKSYCKVNPCPFFHTDIITASFIKYSINSFLATKVVFMNELQSLYLSIGGKHWDELCGIMSSDKRIGASHMKVPGPDGFFGYGGTCFPKDTNAFLNFALDNNISLDVLESAISKNKLIRKPATG